MCSEKKPQRLVSDGVCLYLDPREVWAQSLPVGGLLARLVSARSESALRVTGY